MIKTILLNKLIASSNNVRRRTDAEADLQLKADIEARGVLQNLVVTPVAKPRGAFAVEAGGRRLAALQALAKEGKIARDAEVFCLVIAGDQAQEASLAENFQRLSMNPADECVAFRQLIAQGSDVEGIARRFGLTARFVEGRLRLADLAPVLFEALGAGEISLDIAKAYAAVADHERQIYVFEQMRYGYNASSPDSVRRMMTQASVGASDRRALFVGEEAYVAAGGRIERDLFTEDAGARWLDIAILERLARAKMEAEAERIAAETGLAFVRPTLDSWIGHDQIQGLRRVPVEKPALTEDESAAASALYDELEDVGQVLELEESTDAEREAAEVRIRVLGDQIDAIENKPPVIDEALKARVGAFLMLDEQGRPRLDAGLYVEPQAEDGWGDAGLDDEGGGAVGASPKKAGGLSQRLVDELAMQRRDILAVHVASDPALALDLAIFLMIDREAGYSNEKSGSSLIAAAPSNPVFDFKTPDAASTLAQVEARETLDRTWTEGASRGERFDAFRGLSDEARAAWLGHAVSKTLEASLHLPGERHCAFHDHLGRLLGIEVARWWRPTGANYFDRVPKAITLAALQDVGGASLADRYAKAKKAELSEACERIFAGDFIAEVEVKEAALAWVPGAMRFTGIDVADEALETGSEAQETAEGAEALAPDEGSNQIEEAA